MPKDDRLEFEGCLVFKDLEAQANEAGENHKRYVANAFERMDDPSLVPKQKAAYEAVLPELLALAPSEVCWPGYHPHLVLHDVCGYIDEITQRREELQTIVGNALNLELIFSLERYALATMHTFKLHRDAPAPPESLPRLLQEAADRRYYLLLACDVAFKREARHYEALKGFDGGMVPEAIACDIFLLRRTMLQSDPATGASWYANHQELAHAEQLASTLLQAAVNPTMSAALTWPATDMYTRAFTLVHRACYEAELGLVQVNNTKRPKRRDTPHCIFCFGHPRLLRKHHVWG